MKSERNVQTFELGDILQIGECGDFRVIHSRKLVDDVNGRTCVMYGFVAYWDADLQHEKYSNTAQLPENEPIKKISQILPARVADFLHTYDEDETMDRNARFYRTRDELGDQLATSELIGQMQLLIQENVTTSPERAAAEALLHALEAYYAEKWGELE